MSSFPHLQNGDKIGVFSPGSFIEDEKQLARGQNFLQQNGFQVVIHPQTFARSHQSAGTHAEKASALKELVGDESIKAVLAAGGGNRCLHLLEHIDFDYLSTYTKPLIGFSDVTCLLNAFYAQTGIIGVHGPVLRTLEENAAGDALIRLLKGSSQRPYDLQTQAADVIRPGYAEGPVIGGNLSIFLSLLGTPYLPETRGAILVLEDVQEEVSRLDRALCQLRYARILEHINGLLIGRFTKLLDTGRPYGFSLSEIIHEHIQNDRYPLIQNLSIGHISNNMPFFLGKKALLQADKCSVRLSWK